MAVLEIRFKLKKKGKDYTGFHRLIRAHSWARLSDSAYAVESFQNPSALQCRLKQMVDPKDRLLVRRFAN